MDKQSVTSREEDLMRDRLVKVPELLKLLGMSRPTLEKMIESGRFPKPMSDIYHGARPKRVWKESTVREFLDSRA